MMNQQISTVYIDFTLNEDVFVKNLKSIQNSHKHLTIHNCPTISQAGKIFASQWFQSNSNEFSNIKVEIDEELIARNLINAIQTEFAGQHKLLIALCHDHQKVIYWRGEKHHDLLTVELIENYSANFTAFVQDFIDNDLNVANCGEFLKLFTN